MKADKMDVILVIVGCAVALFTVVMILLYIFTGGIPDTLCQCFYTLCGGECGFMAIIKSFKTMAVKRAWQEEDRENAKKNGETYTFASDDSNYSLNYGEENETIVE